MSSIPSYLTRAPNILVAQGALASLTRTNLSLFKVQEQLVTGRAINRFSDDSIKAATISILDARIDRAGQLKRNHDHADSALATLDKTLGDANELILEAKGIASAQVGTGASAQERAGQAQVINSLIEGLFGIVNRQSVAGYVFGASSPSLPPLQSLLGGYRYTARGDGLLTDLGVGSAVPITLGASALGSTSARVQGTVDLDPILTPDTKLADLAGARGLGITLGTLEFSVDGGPRVQVDLAGADSAQDVVARLNSAIRDYELESSTTILGPAGVQLSGGGISFDMLPGPPQPQLQFFDPTGGAAAADLGLTATTFSSTTPTGADLQPRLTWRTPVAALAGVAGPLGSVRVNNMGQARTLDLSTAQTLEDIKNIFEGAGLGLRVEINAAGSGLNIVNEIAAGKAQALSIEEVPGGGFTASRLGIRSLAADTRIGDFNDGRGVAIAHGGVDPVSGLPNSSLDTDFSITLGDGTRFTVDLRPQDMTTVQTLLDRINQQAAAAGVNVPADFVAGLSEGPNGIELRQNAAFGAPLTVAPDNNSPAAEQLGLMGLNPAGPGIFRGEDRATVRVDNLFTALIDLRDALLNDDTIGITLAGERLEAATDRVAQTRATVGAYARRVADGTRRLEDQDVLDQTTRSQLRDLDYTEAAVRLNLLQTQLQAGFQVTSQMFSRSLLDFLG
jgi:flagellin-like hook-associated protein FlgL